MAEKHDRILGYFLEEAIEHLDTIEQGLLDLPQTVKQPETIRELFRAAHSIKGSAAMLGLLDIQKIGNQFEANFKLLKEQPQIAVDSHLQSLFLESFGFLKAGIEEVRTSSDPYRQDPATIDPIGDPVFEELKAYLQHLLAAETDVLVPAQRITSGRKDPAIDGVFGDYVTRKLDTMLGLCLQPDLPAVRTEIQQICQKLGNLGENFEFIEWTQLFTACKLATANSANFLPQLGESISIAVKQAQALVLADRHQEIRVTADLEALIISKTATLGDADLQSTAALTPKSSPVQSNLSTWNLNTEATTQQLPELVSIGTGSTLPLATTSQLLDFDTTNNLFADTNSAAFLSEFDPEAGELNDFMNLLGDELPSDGSWSEDDEFGDLMLPSIDLEDLAKDPLHSQMFESATNLPSAPPSAEIAEMAEIDLALVTAARNNLPLVPETYDEETFYTPDLSDLDEQIPDFSSTTELSIDRDRQIYADLNSIDNLDDRPQPDLSPSLPLAASLAPDFGLDYPISNLFPTTATPEDWSNLEDLPVDSIESVTATNDADLFNDESLQVATTGMFSATAHEEPALTNNALELPTPVTLDRSDSAPVELEPQHTEAEAIDASTTSSEILGLEDLDRSLNSPESSEILGLEDIGSHKFPDAADLSGLENLNATQPESFSDPLFLSELDSLEADGLNLNSPQDDLAAFDLGVSADVPDFELDIQNFDDLELNSAIDNNSLEDLDLDLLARSSISDDAIDLQSDPSQWHDLAELDLQLSPDNQLDLDASPVPDLLDLNSDSSDRERVNAIDPIEPATERDFDSIDLDNLEADADPAAQFDDLSSLDFDLDNLSADLGTNDLSLDGLLDEMPADNLPDLGNLDALLGLTAVGIGAAFLTSQPQSALDDLDALVATSPTADGNLDDLDALVATNPTVENNLNDLDALVVSAPAPVVAPVAPKPARESKDRRPKQSRTFEQTMRVSVRHLNNLNNLVGELVVNRNTLEQDQNRMRQFVEKLLSEVQKLNEVGKRMQDLYERSLMENSLVASRQQSKPSTPTPSSNGEEVSGSNSGSIEYDPLEMDRFTPIHLLSQKMIELTVRVRESTADIEFVVDGSTEVTRTLRQITGQLQEDLTKSRMVPFAQTADRLQRGVRENGLKYGKQVELSVEGRDTLIDKVILESLTDPLIHMVNNAIAHGIESSEIRQANSKSSEGKITIRALHQGNQTIISVSDDGAGIDIDRVKQKALEKGIITAAQAADMSANEAYELLFLPSFSTKDQADELAGRGVGMDVVRTSITEIRGTIATESKLGTGTTFTIRLPLALSIAKALIAVNNKTNIAFPMDGIEDTQDVSPEQIQTDSDGKQCIFWRDELMPFTPLSELLSFNRPLARNSFYSTNEDDSDLVSILILRSDGQLTAVQVDKITADREIVIKPLQGPASKPLGIAGATVMGDGRIVPIADVMELIALANGTLSRQVSTQWTDRMAAPTVEIRESMVLIVDDSITVRELLSLTFKRAGYRVEQARDGQEAWDKLRAGLPCDIVFCDIEMPRMDGLEFLSRIQKDAALSKVPVAMLTSRGSDRHRQIAAQLGASGYFIKPYLEEALLDAAKRMIKGEVLEIV
jgi:chemotaxis protein histidine kinase CheA/ActR/RegA family two-component response regulator